jgi:hypothetical protein
LPPIEKAIESFTSTLSQYEVDPVNTRVSLPWSPSTLDSSTASVQVSGAWHEAPPEELDEALLLDAAPLLAEALLLDAALLLDEAPPLDATGLDEGAVEAPPSAPPDAVAPPAPPAPPVSTENVAAVVLPPPQEAETLPAASR